MTFAWTVSAGTKRPRRPLQVVPSPSSSNAVGIPPAGGRIGIKGCGGYSSAIIDANRKTEICRNWRTGSCAYGDKCAFAHGVEDLRVQTLDELAEAGRIPNATKFRSYPCLTWVATGCCPYQSRCVFLHDPRLRSTPASRDVSGTTTPEALSTPTSSRASTPLSTGRGGSRCESRGEVLGTGPGSGLGMRAARDFFYWPDVVREPIPEGVPSPSTSTSSAPRRAKLPACEATYELSSTMADSDKTGDVTGAAVYHLWYSLVETVLDEKGIPTETAANGHPAVAPTHLPIFQQLATGERVAPPDMPMPALPPSECGRTSTSAFAATLITQGSDGGSSSTSSSGGSGGGSSSSSSGSNCSSSEAMMSTVSAHVDPERARAAAPQLVAPPQLSNAAAALSFNRDVPHGFVLPLLRLAQPQQQLHEQQQQQQLSMASTGAAAALEQQLLQWRQRQQMGAASFWQQQQQQQQRQGDAAALLSSRYALVPTGAPTITPPAALEVNRRLSAVLSAEGSADCSCLDGGRAAFLGTSPSMESRRSFSKYNQMLRW